MWVGTTASVDGVLKYVALALGNSLTLGLLSNQSRVA